LAIDARDFCGFGQIAARLNQQLAPIVDLERFQRFGISHFTLSACASGLITGAARVVKTSLEKIESPLSRNVSQLSQAQRLVAPQIPNMSDFSQL
jgi:hypothetical protein